MLFIGGKLKYSSPSVKVVKKFFLGGMQITQSHISPFLYFWEVKILVQNSVQVVDIHYHPRRILAIPLFSSLSYYVTPNKCFGTLLHVHTCM